MPPPAVTPRTLFAAFGALLLLLLAAALVPHLPSGPWSGALSLAIAAAKVAVIALCFMQLRYHRGLIRVFAGAGLFWLGIALALTLADYLTR